MRLLTGAWRDSVAAVAAGLVDGEGLRWAVGEDLVDGEGLRWAEAAGEDVVVGAGAVAVGADTEAGEAAGAVVGGPITGAEAATDGAQVGGRPTMTPRS